MTQADATPLYIEEKGDGTYTITNGPTDLEDFTANDIALILLSQVKGNAQKSALSRARLHFMNTRINEARHDWDQIASKWEGGEYRIETTSPKAAE